MNPTNILESQQELTTLCEMFRKLIEHDECEKCEELIKEAMGKYPHAPEPHNLMGLLLETQHDHVNAMRHFRASWALDPTYLPARQNMDNFSSFYPTGKWAYDDSGCPKEVKEKNNYKIVYDEHGVGHLDRRDER